MNTAHQNDSTARILVPDNMDAEMPIAKGSGIVAVSMDEDMDVVYYEGNIYGASNLPCSA
ncbi:hypothetical protein [Aliidiomarina quisquiliarum]|uniref:hypothetical protein n=1 Tax=Aliidiomarina quisquiliarum TaxID=2938947 RepID=UPI00208DE842|nr:hypothetical protein [Aliidiomarina quisquiliarum]MCO4319968.1 hypothetical protein [Aliidiomarina quisquiliarum]